MAHTTGWFEKLSPRVSDGWKLFSRNICKESHPALISLRRSSWVACFFAPRILFFLKTADVISQQEGFTEGYSDLKKHRRDPFGVPGSVHWVRLSAQKEENSDSSSPGFGSAHQERALASLADGCHPEPTALLSMVIKWILSLGPDFHQSKMAITRPERVSRSRPVITPPKDRIPPCLEEGRRQYPRRWNNQTWTCTHETLSPQAAPNAQRPVHCCGLGTSFPVPFLRGRTVGMRNWAMGYQEEFRKLMQRMCGSTWPCSAWIRCIWWLTGLGQAVGWQRC